MLFIEELRNKDIEKIKEITMVKYEGQLDNNDVVNIIEEMLSYIDKLENDIKDLERVDDYE